MFLSNHDLIDLIAWRRKLHPRPEISGEERRPRARSRPSFRTAPDHIVSGLGGTGVAVVYGGAAPAPTVMFRAELDALPIEELTEVPYRSQVAGERPSLRP